MEKLHYIDDCAKRRILFFTGKGGVGKSTVAWATALACRRRGMKVTVAGWTPFGGEYGTAPFAALGIDFVRLDTMIAFREYALQVVKFEKIYDAVLDNRVLRTFVLAAPGLSDTVIAGKLWTLYDQGKQDLLIVDLPSSGHAVSFFSSPLGVKKIFRMGFVHRETEKICAMFAGVDARIDLVALPEELPLVECLQLKERLQGLHPFRFGFLHVNQCFPELPAPASEQIAKLPADAREAVERFRGRVERERQTLALADEIGLPQLRTERLASEALLPNVEWLAERLESA